MTTQSFSRSTFWALALGAFVLVIWALQAMLLPFVAGTIIAYFLNPLVEGLVRRAHVGRSLGSLIALALFIAAAVFLFLLIAPVLHSQIATLVDALPGYVEDLRARALPWAHDILTKFPGADVGKLQSATGDMAGNVVGWTGKLLRSVLTGGAALINTLGLLVITPVVAFYLLRDWPKVVHNLDELLPRHRRDVIREQCAVIDRTLSGFLRGQALVCLCLGFIYGAGLTLVGLKYGATIGIVAGVLSFIPYAGSSFMLVASMLLACVQFDSAGQIATVFVVFLVGQSLEGYVLTPKLVGDRVGLHPVWILFALFAGASLFGFLGVLIAVPTAAILGVLTRFALAQYRDSPLYRG